MKTTLIIDGGLGRVITAIPALEVYVENNPDTIILTNFWTSLFWGNKKLTKHVFDVSTKGIFDVIKYTKIVKPEPYHNSDYLQGKIHLMDAWNVEINNSTDKLPIPKIYLTKTELNNMSFIRNNYYTKIIAFQPFGSTAAFDQSGVLDNSQRSLNRETTEKIIKMLKDEGYGIWLMSDKVVPFLDYSNLMGVGSSNLREVFGLLYHCDYFLGIDSCGQHMSRALNIPGTVIMGGTNTINVTYPDYFNILNHRDDREYMPYRIAEFDTALSELSNHDIMDFTDKEIHLMCKNIKKHIAKTVRTR
jgi:ADP-heptose:LPS heptosyltransferase